MKNSDSSKVNQNLKDLNEKNTEEIDSVEKQLIEEARKKGDSYYILDLGSEYYNGVVREQNFAKAFEYYTIASEMGNVIALSNLGYCYLYGRSVPKDTIKALECYEAAADLGDINATYKVGDFYYWGIFPITQDREKAVEYYLTAYDLVIEDEYPDISNYPDVCLRLADCIFYGLTDFFDLEDALDFYNEAKVFFDIRINEYNDRMSDKLLKRAEEGILKTRQRIAETEDDSIGSERSLQ
ncbi:MAG TPA: sel1 repeat family protein [Clostridiaceae bacterium]|nr:sel1 repeat family protein [Clostridiaceae bacterium]